MHTIMEIEFPEPVRGPVSASSLLPVASAGSFRPTVRSSRQHAVSLFCDAMPDMDARRVAVMLSHLRDVGDLHHFLKECGSKRNFAAYFQWALRPGKK